MHLIHSQALIFKKWKTHQAILKSKNFIFVQLLHVFMKIQRFEPDTKFKVWNDHLADIFYDDWKCHGSWFLYANHKDKTRGWVVTS